MQTIENSHDVFIAKRTEVTTLLTSQGIDVSEYGKGEAKTLDHLTNEVLGGEAALLVEENGELCRKIRIAAIHVLYLDDVGDWWELYEDIQKFADGRKRTRKLPQSLSEKLVANENIDEAVFRALEEELGIKEALVASYDLGVSVSRRVSQSYPGLTTSTEINEYIAVLDPESIRDEYQEVQADKTTTWLWRRAE